MKEHKHCMITQHELTSMLELNFTIIKEDIINHRYSTLRSLPINDTNYQLMKQNLKFLSRLSIAVAQMYEYHDVYYSFDYFMKLYLERNFSEHKSFYWYELKSIFFMAIYFKDVKTYKEFEKKIKQQLFHDTLCKYKRKDAIDKSSIQRTERYYQIYVANKQLKISF